MITMGAGGTDHIDAGVVGSKTLTRDTTPSHRASEGTFGPAVNSGLAGAHGEDLPTATEAGNAEIEEERDDPTSTIQTTHSY